MTLVSLDRCHMGRVQREDESLNIPKGNGNGIRGLSSCTTFPEHTWSRTREEVMRGT